MPVTARLSRRFYEQFGDDLTNELVNWFNAVDSTYRTDLKELNELNFARFDAKVEQRFAASEARLEVKMEQRFAAAEVKMEQRFAATEVKMEQRLAALESKMEQRFASSESRMIRWLFTLWTGTTLTTAGLLFAMLRSR